jgi:hypothetical protein
VFIYDMSLCDIKLCKNYPSLKLMHLTEIMYSVFESEMVPLQSITLRHLLRFTWFQRRMYSTTRQSKPCRPIIPSPCKPMSSLSQSSSTSQHLKFNGSLHRLQLQFQFKRSKSWR